LDRGKFTAEEYALIQGSATGTAFNNQKKAARESADFSFEHKDTESLKKEVAKSLYGPDATVDGNKIKYKDGDEEKEVELTEEEWKTNYATMKAT
jgi:hypothetical protein